MSDEVSTGELARRLDTIQNLLQGLVSRVEYTADQRLSERRFTELERDLEAERIRRHTEIKELRNEIAASAKEKGMSVRQGVYSGLIPSLLMLVSVVVTIILTMTGGK